MITTLTPAMINKTEPGQLLGRIYRDTLDTLELGAASAVSSSCVLRATMGSANIDALKARGLYTQALTVVESATHSQQHVSTLEARYV